MNIAIIIFIPILGLNMIDALGVRLAVQSLLSNQEKDFTGGTSAITEAATAKLKQIASFNSTSTSSSLSLLAVGATITALSLAHSSIEAHKSADKNAGDLFRLACESGTATYFLPSRLSDCTEEQLFFTEMRKYLKKKINRLASYANIHFTDNVETTKPGILWGSKISGTSFSIISYATLFASTGYENVASDDSILEASRRSCDLFIRAKLSNMMETISSYRPKSILGYSTNGGFRSDVYQSLSFVQFLTLAFSNMLMTLQCPPHLNDKEVLELAAQVRAVINDMILSEKFSYLRDKILLKDEFMNFLTSMRREVEGLQRGYKSRMLNSLSLGDTVGQCYGILQELTTLWHQILFLDKPHTKPEDLMYVVRCVTSALNEFGDSGNLKKLLNMPREQQPSVLELIGNFSTLTAKDRRAVVEKLSGFGVEISEISQLSSGFIEPLTELILSIPKDANKNKNKNKANTEVFVQSIILNLIALSVESLPPFLPERPQGVDFYKQCAQMNREKSFLHKGILKMLNPPDTNELSPRLKKVTIDNMEQLLAAHYDFLEATRDLATLHVLFERHRSMILNQGIQERLFNRLAEVSKTGSLLQEKLYKLYTTVNGEDRILGNLKDKDGSIHNSRRLVILQSLCEESVLQYRVKIMCQEVERVKFSLMATDFGKLFKDEFKEDVIVLLNAVSSDEDKKEILQILHESGVVTDDTLLLPYETAAASPSTLSSVRLTV